MTSTRPVTICFDVTEDTRKALRFRTGERGKATDAEVEAFIRMAVYATLQDIEYEYINRRRR